MGGGSNGPPPKQASILGSASSFTQQSENFGYSSVRLRRIAKLQFGIVNPNELVRYYL